MRYYVAYRNTSILSWWRNYSKSSEMYSESTQVLPCWKDCFCPFLLLFDSVCGFGHLKNSSSTTIKSVCLGTYLSLVVPFMSVIFLEITCFWFICWLWYFIWWRDTVWCLIESTKKYIEERYPGALVEFSFQASLFLAYF